MLYKFLSAARISVLRDGLIRFSQVGALNDPAESLALAPGDDRLKELADESIQGFDDMVRRHPPGDVDMGANRVFIERVRKNLVRKYERMFLLQQRGHGMMRHSHGNVGILSLSRACDDFLMWAHYADAHTGFVIGMDEDNEFFHLPDAAGFPTSPSDVLYTAERLPVTRQDPENHVKYLCQKSHHWAYEKEVRAFRHLQNSPSGTDAKGYPVHLFRIDPAAIRKVIIGANASSALKARIVSAVKKNKLDVQIFKAVLRADRFELCFLPVSGVDYGDSAYWLDVTYRFPQLRNMLPIDIDAVEKVKNTMFQEYEFPGPSAMDILVLHKLSMHDRKPAGKYAVDWIDFIRPEESRERVYSARQAGRA